MKGWPLLLGLSLLLAACGGGAPGGELPLRALASIAVLADFVRQVGGERVAVTSLLPPGADPHTYEPTPAQVKAVREARVIFINGLGLEGPALKVIRQNRRPGTPLISLAEGLPVREDNPHLWLDVSYAMRYVERVRDALIRLDPEGRGLYEGRAEAYLRRLARLDEEIRGDMAAIPPERRKLVTFHDSFLYFARRYGLKVVAYVVKSPGREPGAGEVAELVEAIRREGVPAVFREPQVQARILELAARDAGVRVGTLYSDALGDGVDSYIEMMRFNARQLRELLGP